MTKKIQIVRHARGMHESGSKFYELVLLYVTFDDDSFATFMIRRYGKKAVWERGGATQVETANNRTYMELLRQKKRGGYNFDETDSGLGKFASDPALGTNYMNLEKFVRFYLGTSQDNQIFEKFGLTASEAMVKATRTVEKAATIPFKPPAPAIPGWGAW